MWNSNQINETKNLNTSKNVPLKEEHFGEVFLCLGHFQRRETGFFI